MFVVSKIRMAEDLGIWEKTGLRRRLGYLEKQTPVGRGDRASLFLMALSVILTFGTSNIGGNIPTTCLQEAAPADFDLSKREINVWRCILLRRLRRRKFCF